MSYISPMAKTKSMTCPYCGSAAIFTQHPVLKCFFKGGEMRTYADNYGRAFGSGFRIERDECEFYEPEQVCLWRCPNCRKLVLEVAGKISYPTGSGISAVDCMPQEAKEVFEEAQSIINLSPRAACAMLRICVERMVNASGAEGGNLDRKINSLGLPATMASVAHACRLVGNDAVHNNAIDFPWAAMRHWPYLALCLDSQTALLKNFSEWQQKPTSGPPRLKPQGPTRNNIAPPTPAERARALARREEA